MKAQPHILTSSRWSGGGFGHNSCRDALRGCYRCKHTPDPYCGKVTWGQLPYLAMSSEWLAEVKVWWVLLQEVRTPADSEQEPICFHLPSQQEFATWVGAWGARVHLLALSPKRWAPHGCLRGPSSSRMGSWSTGCECPRAQSSAGWPPANNQIPNHAETRDPRPSTLWLLDLSRSADHLRTVNGYPSISGFTSLHGSVCCRPGLRA